MRVVLCAPLSDNPMDRSCPFGGILALAGVLDAQTAHKVRVVQPVEYPVYRGDLERQLSRCDALAISSSSYNWYAAQELAVAARTLRPNLKIVLGGVHPSWLPGHCLRSTGADYVVRFEGEVTFPLLLDALERGHDPAAIEGLTWRNADGTTTSTPDRMPLTAAELDRMPLPAFQRVPPGVYGYMPIEASRGCRFDCAFCGTLFRKSHRVVSPARIEALIAQLKKCENRFVEQGLFFADDAFATRPRETCEILALTSPTGYVLGVESRYHDLLRPEIEGALERNRFYLIQVGVENGYQDGIDRIGKHMKLDAIYRFADRVRTRSYRTALRYSMAVGFPWEQERDIRSTIDTGYELASRSASPDPFVNNFNPLPGAAMITHPQDFGMPPLADDFWDDRMWWAPFLAYTSIPRATRDALAAYVEVRRSRHARRDM